MNREKDQETENQKNRKRKETESLNANSKYCFIPAGLTGLLQPADVCWFKNLKVIYIKYWNIWFETGKKYLTKHGNVCGPGYDLMTQWISQGWLDLTPTYLAESFTYCGITTDEIDKFHSNLINILVSPILPPNTVVEVRDETDDHENIFVIDEEDMIYEITNKEDLNDQEDSDDSDVSGSIDLLCDDNTSSSDGDLENTSPVVSPATKSTSLLATPVTQIVKKPRATENSNSKAKTALTPIQVNTLSQTPNIQDLKLKARVEPAKATPKAKPAPKVKEPPKAKPATKAKVNDDVAASTSTASNTVVYTAKTRLCHKCNKNVNWRECDYSECSNWQCIPCYKLKILKSDIFFCSRECRNKE